MLSQNKKRTGTVVREQGHYFKTLISANLSDLSDRTDSSDQRANSALRNDDCAINNVLISNGLK